MAVSVRLSSLQHVCMPGLGLCLGRPWGFSIDTHKGHKCRQRQRNGRDDSKQTMARARLPFLVPYFLSFMCSAHSLPLPLTHIPYLRSLILSNLLSYYSYLPKAPPPPPPQTPPNPKTPPPAQRNHRVVLYLRTCSSSFLASGSFSKCFRTGSRMALMALVTAGLRSPGWIFPDL